MKHFFLLSLFTLLNILAQDIPTIAHLPDMNLPEMQSNMEDLEDDMISL